VKKQKEEARKVRQAEKQQRRQPRLEEATPVAPTTDDHPTPKEH
jgi:hypothetical protein